MTVLLYLALVQLHLESYSVWGLHCKEDIEVIVELEHFQTRAKKVVTGLKCRSCASKELLRELGGLAWRKRGSGRILLLSTTT